MYVSQTLILSVPVEIELRLDKTGAAVRKVDDGLVNLNVDVKVDEVKTNFDIGVKAGDDESVR